MSSVRGAPGSDAGAIRVVVVADDPLLRVGLECLLGKIDGVAVVADADEATAHDVAAGAGADVVVHGDLPAGRAKGSGLPLHSIVLGNTDDPVDVETAFAAGAAAFLAKSRVPEHLVAAIRTVAAGGRFLDPEVGARVAAGLARERPRSATGLSRRERAVLALLSDGRTNDEIASELGISPRTVEGHRTRLGKKLGLRRRAELVEYALLHHLAAPVGPGEDGAE